MLKFKVKQLNPSAWHSYAVAKHLPLQSEKMFALRTKKAKTRWRAKNRRVYDKPSHTISPYDHAHEPL